jgi:hypothetical protein
MIALERAAENWIIWRQPWAEVNRTLITGWRESAIPCHKSEQSGFSRSNEWIGMPDMAKAVRFQPTILNDGP